MLNNSSILSVLLLKSAWVNSSVFCEGQCSPFFLFFLVHNWPECVRSTGFFRHLSHKNDSQCTSSETLPTTYSQSLNGWWFHIVISVVEFAFFCTIYASVERCWAYPFPWIHDARPAEKETWGKRLRFISHWMLIGLSLTNHGCEVSYLTLKVQLL